jgi:hypothetical protein
MAPAHRSSFSLSVVLPCTTYLPPPIHQASWLLTGHPSWVGPCRLTAPKSHTSHSYRLRDLRPALACSLTHKTPPLLQIYAHMCYHARPACLSESRTDHPKWVGPRWRPVHEFGAPQHAGLRPLRTCTSLSHHCTQGSGPLRFHTRAHFHLMY